MIAARDRLRIRLEWQPLPGQARDQVLQPLLVAAPYRHLAFRNAARSPCVSPRLASRVVIYIAPWRGVA